MTKHIEKLKKQLAEIADAVNAFQSETVQLKIIARLLPQLDYWNTTADKQGVELPPNTDIEPIIAKTTNAPKPIGATRIVKQLLASDYFDTPRGLNEITDYCNQLDSGKFYTYNLSGVLLKFVQRNELIRRKMAAKDNYIYLKPVV